MVNDIDLSSKYRRQIYLITFPLGALLSAAYLWISASNISPINTFIAIAVSVLLSILFLSLLLNPDFLHTAESIFYFSISLYFVVYSHVNVNLTTQVHQLTEAHLSDVITGMGMWLVIMLIGAFLSLSTRQFRALVIVNILVILLAFSRNMFLLRSAGLYEFGYLYRWLNIFLALFVAILLIQRIGRLQQIYASTDVLTGVLNRRATVNTLVRELRRVDRYNKNFSLILFDVDKFKMINDTFGHAAGDQTLREISNLVIKLIRDVDHLGRWGGEEFLVILPETEREKAILVAKRICKTIHENPFTTSGNLTASFGVATYVSGQSMDDMLHAADLGMYEAKNRGGNQVVCLDYVDDELPLQKE